MTRACYSRGWRIAQLRNLLGFSQASATLPAMGAGKAIPVGGAFGGFQGAKLEKEI